MHVTFGGEAGGNKMVFTREPPSYDGTSCPSAYIRTFEKFAIALKWDADARLRWLPTYLVDTADEWYQMLVVEGKWFESYDEAKAGLLSHFQINETEDVKLSDLTKIKQGKLSVRSYATEFKGKAVKLPELSEKQRVDLFIEGLQNGHKKFLRVLEVKSLERAITLAMRLEEGKEPDVECQEEQEPEPKELTQQTSKEPKSVDELAKELANLRLYKMDMERKIQQANVCATCFQPGHSAKKCPNKTKGTNAQSENRLLEEVHFPDIISMELPEEPQTSLELLSMATAMEIDPPTTEKPKVILKIPRTVVEQSKKRLFEESSVDKDAFEFIRKLKTQRITFTLYELIRISPYFREQVMKLVKQSQQSSSELLEMHTESVGAPRYPAKLQGHSVIAIIDGGSAINVIQKNLAQQLGFTINTTAVPRPVKLGDGSTVLLNQYVADVNLTIGEITMPISALLMDCPDYELLLGRNWLNKVEALTIWKRGLFRIRWHGQEADLIEKVFERPANEVECCSLSLMNELPEGEVWTDIHPPAEMDQTSTLLNQISLCSELSTEQKRSLEKLIEEYRDTFAADLYELEQTDVITHSIALENQKPIKQRAYRMSPGELNFLQQEIAKMLDKGIIHPANSPWASPVVIVSKKNGSYRLCVNFKKVNAITTRDTYPLPLDDDLLNTVSGSKFYSSLDLFSGYWQVPMSEDSMEIATFTCKFGTYSFTVMPFGLTNAPATFQRLMDNVLSEQLKPTLTF